jgi:hypothetical protein
MDKPMRLTLRTLLAYLDDTLEPAQAKQIGQKVAESDTAQELIARIKQVTRRRRLTTPPETGPNKLDANAIAEYLDNTLDADQLADVEQICLASDVHLAEMASCHQILTLVLGEPVLVPPTAKQRMYGVVKGREAIPFRKPPAAATAAEPEVAPVEGKEVDETLRLGLPALRTKEGWRNPLIVLGGILGLVACLVIAIINLLPSSPSDESGGARKDDNRQASADQKKADGDRREQGDADKSKKVVPPADQQSKGDKSDGAKADGAKADATKTDGGKQDGKQTDEAKKDGGGKADGATKSDAGKKDDGGKGDKVVPPKSIDVPTGPPSERVAEIGRFDAPKPGASTTVPVLLQFGTDKADKGEWKRLERPGSLRVVTGQPLVSLPGYRSVVLIDSGVRLTLDGTMPEYFPGTPLLFESLVELHHHDVLDLDLTLRRGRILLANTHSDRPVRVRVRFENTTNPESKEMWDLTLEEKDAEVLIDCFAFFPPDERFHEDPKNRDRTGPVTQIGLTVLNGSVRLRMDSVTHVLRAPPGPARMVWNSERGPAGPLPLQRLEDWTRPNPPLPKGLPKEVEGLRRELRQAANQLSLDLFGAPELGILKSLSSAEPTRRKLAVRACGALDMLPRLVDALTDKNRPDVRQSAIETLSRWITSSRDYEYRLFDALKGRYSPVEAEKIVTLLHGPPGKGRFVPQTYEVLIEQLASPRMPIRDLAAWQLFQLVPRAREVRFDPTAPPERHQAQWRKLIPRGTIPPEYQKIIDGGK